MKPKHDKTAVNCVRWTGDRAGVDLRAVCPVCRLLELGWTRIGYRAPQVWLSPGDNHTHWTLAAAWQCVSRDTDA